MKKLLFCSLLWCLRLFSRPPLGAVLCGCPDGLALARVVAVGGLAVRPSVWLLWWLWWACLGCFVSAVRICAVAFPCPCRFGAFFCRSLPCSVVGWCVCLSVGFRGNLGCLSALLGGCPCFWLAVPSGHRATRPYFGASEWGSDYPLKISEKNFSPMWCGRMGSGGFP